MSINVTVSGNPVSIKRGRMVTCDPYHGKKEFEKRRLMRLEQVRQQSKDIAENVRNKVRTEKKKQLNHIEAQSKEKLRNWQNRKLLELQMQYKEALRDLGAGHKQAVELEAESEVLEEQKEFNKQIAAHRNQVAATHLQIQKNKESFKKSVPIQQKKVVRDLENTRAVLVSKKKPSITEPNKRNRKRKKASADINITISDSNSESEDIALLNLEEMSEQDKEEDWQEEYIESAEGEEKSSEHTESSEEPREPLELNKNDLGKAK